MKHWVVGSPKRPLLQRRSSISSVIILAYWTVKWTVAFRFFMQASKVFRNWVNLGLLNMLLSTLLADFRALLSPQHIWYTLFGGQRLPSLFLISATNLESQNNKASSVMAVNSCLSLCTDSQSDSTTTETTQTDDLGPTPPTIWWLWFRLGKFLFSHFRYHQEILFVVLTVTDVPRVGFEWFAQSQQ